MAIQFDSDEDDLAEAHEINVTPFIDVILVLLIIFMVAAPLATVDVKVDLPRSTAEQQQRPDKPIFPTLRSDQTLSLGDAVVQRDHLGVDLDRITDGDETQRVFLRADKTVPYGDLMAAMDRLRAGGYLKVALVALEQTAGQ